MEKRTWWKKAVIYQIYPRSFMVTHEDMIRYFALLGRDNGRTPMLEDRDEIYAYKRVLDDDIILVLCNFTDRTVSI